MPSQVVSNEAKILFIDIETSPNLSYMWGHYEQNALAVESYWHLLSFSAKWLGGKSVTKGLIDYPGYRSDKENDKKLVADIWKLLDEADIVIGHNVNAFDLKKINARFSFHKLLPPSPYKTVDTLTVARRHFAFHSNKLNDLCVFLGVGQKISTGGFELWKKCMEGDSASWKKMKAYNKNDVDILEKVYLELRPWMSHPNMGMFSKGIVCPNCSSDKLQARGFAINKTTKYRRFQCQSCGTWSRNTTNEQDHRVLVNV